ncbi:leucine-rich repeat domain-containing protein [Salinimicrobium xinjiangense]|uniref:hypothetical protein n=1 Tax=Salinimicrobium xinjiangense TaxID=438596 RepID=UPI00048AD11D|nr:hypothetical protein [Salinimicrobium xinjiangense]
MKRSLLPLLLLLLLIISCEPENLGDPHQEPPPRGIDITDDYLKQVLISTYCNDTNNDNIGDRNVDLNNDGEIQRTEAELIEALVIDFFNPEIKESVNLTGIENFVNLRRLTLSGLSIFSVEQTPKTELLSYDLTDLKNLEYLEVNVLTTNHYKALDLSGLTNLKELKLINNRPYYLGYTEENIKLPVNFLDVNLAGTNSLTKLDISNSFLNIDFCQIPSLKELKMSHLNGGEPETFDFHCLTSLEWLDISENLIKTLILKNSSVLHTLIAEDIGYGEEGFANYPYIEQICIDDIPEEFEQIATLRDENTVVVTDCGF